MKAVRPIIASSGDPSLHMMSVGSHSTSGREEEGKKESTGGDILSQEVSTRQQTLHKPNACTL